MAAFTKRGPYQWQAKIRRRGYDPQSKTFNSRAEAEAWVATVESEMARGVFVSRSEAENTTLVEALDRYEQEVSSQKKRVRSGKVQNNLATISFGREISRLAHRKGSRGLAGRTSKKSFPFDDKQAFDSLVPCVYDRSQGMGNGGIDESRRSDKTSSKFKAAGASILGRRGKSDPVRLFEVWWGFAIYFRVCGRDRNATGGNCRNDMGEGGSQKEDGHSSGD